MFALLTFGSIWYWLLLAQIVILSIVFVETAESGFGATVTFLVGIVLLSNTRDLLGLLHQPGNLILYTLVYLAVGLAWSFLKWYLYVRRRLYEYNERIQVSHFRNEQPEAPIASEHKGDLIRWMTYWPWSMLGTALNDFVYKLWHHIYRHFSGLFQRISDTVFTNAVKEFEKAAAAKKTNAT